MQPLNGRFAHQGEPTIVMHDVEFTFNRANGVFDLNLEIPPGVIFGLIGPSGCGKTTTVRLLTGLLQPSRGFVHILGHNPAAAGATLRERIGYMPQHFVLYPNLTVWENINFVASLYGMSYFSRRDRLRELLAFVELDAARSKLGKQLSGGMQRRLELACALVHNPRLIFADEPTAGIDPVLRQKFWEHFRSLRNEGNTLFITTQYVGEAAYCDFVGVMSAGRLLYVETPEKLRRIALGGEVIRMAVEPEHARRAADTLQSHPLVHDVRRSRSTPGHLYVYVDDAGEALPGLISMLDNASGMALLAAEEYHPPFDDVFVALMEQARVRHA